MYGYTYGYRYADTLCVHVTRISDYRILHTGLQWIQELIHVVEKPILFCRLSVVFLSKIKYISHVIAFTGIVLDIDRKFLVICKQSDEKIQCIKHRVSIGLDLMTSR